jgi:hypothetical protein
MNRPAAQRATIYFDSDVHKALRLKAANTGRPISGIVNDAVRQLFREDQVDVAAFLDRAGEPTISRKALIKSLKAIGKF